MTADLGNFLLTFLLPPLVVMFFQAILNRLAPRLGLQPTTILSMVLGYVGFFYILTWIPFATDRDSGFYVYMFLLYSFSAYTYFHVFNMSVTARRIRLISFIGRNPGASLNQLKELYNAKEMFTVRLDRLQSLGQIEFRDGRYFPKGRLLANASTFMYALGSAVARPWPEIKKFRASQRSR